MDGQSEEAHPRSRGENLSRAAWTLLTLGSSPLTRGKRERRRDPIAGARLIPAHAGKTRLFSADFLYGRAHPRSRGENEMTNVYLGTAGGSSPLTRGKHCRKKAVRL